MDNELSSDNQKQGNNTSAVDVDEKTVGIGNERIAVKQRIGLVGAIPFVMGSVIGSGIFISPKGALKYSGSVGLSLVIWGLCGVLSMLLGLVYAELGSRIPRSGGDYTYIKSQLGSIPAFLVTWSQTVLYNPAGMAVQTLVFADYLCAPIFIKCEAPNSIRKTIAAVEILTLAITNCLSVRFAAVVQGFFTVVKVIALIIITVGGFLYLGRGKVENFENAFDGSTNDVTSFTFAIYNCMWAYAGYTAVNTLAEEIIRPKKNIPLAIVISLTLITLIYITTNVSYFTLLSKPEFLSVPAVAFEWGNKVLGTAAVIIPLCVMCSVHGTLNGGFFSHARVRFAASRAGHLPEIFSFLHHKSRIPIVSLVLNSTASLILLSIGDTRSLMNLVSFLFFLTNCLSTISLLVMRYKDRYNTMNSDLFSTPIVVPVLALLICIFMLVSPFISNPRIEIIYGVIFVAAGLVFYVPFIHFQWIIPGWDTVTMYAQMFSQCCPTLSEDELDHM